MTETPIIHCGFKRSLPAERDAIFEVQKYLLKRIQTYNEVAHRYGEKPIPLRNLLNTVSSNRPEVLNRY